MTIRNLLMTGATLASLLAAQLIDAGSSERISRHNKPMEGYLIGYQAVLVDYYWFDLLQYFGGYSLGDHDLSAFNARFERLTELAPDFHRATIFAAMIRADDMEDPSGALRWLERAEERNPEFWFYPYEQGFLHYLWLGNYPEAINAFRRAGLREGAPSSWRHFVARITELGGDPQVAREMWLQIAEAAEHPRVREAALGNVERLEAMLLERQRDRSADEL